MNRVVEKDIMYRLVKTGERTSDCYHAVMQHNALGAHETLDEIVANTHLPPMTIESAVGGALDTMVSQTLADGRTRRFGDWFETRCDILGRFDRIDEAFDPARHKLAINLLPLTRIDRYQRDNSPINERKRPRGRIDYVTWPGGDKGEVKVGENILIVGHDLELAPHDSIELRMEIDGRRVAFVTHLYVYPGEEQTILEHDDTHILVKWFAERSGRLITNQDAILFFSPWTREETHAGKEPMRGSSSHVKVIC